ncbi:MAG: FAD-dependent oxidoreductase, partial [Candidatus Aenigmarchaeota archaeon]|nr:FAD-dependent oxidoreductase [Candidatus Aenigmarchaeota archaeon]
MYDTIIIGTGCAGLAGAMYAGRLNLKTLVIGDIAGGTIILTDTVENYPGFKKLTGQELADKLLEHAKDYPVEIMEDKVAGVAEQGDGFLVKTEREGKDFLAKTIIIATGTRHKELDVPGEKQFHNKGVHNCALCDAPLYKNKTVAVVGGSDSAAKEALVLAQHAAKVYMIYRGEQIRPEPVNMKRIQAAKNIEIINHTNVLEIKGEKKVTQVMLDKPYQGSKEFKLDGVFVAIGLIPLSGLAKRLGVELNAKGEIIIDRESRTNIPGVFAAGDVV